MAQLRGFQGRTTLDVEHFLCRPGSLDGTEGPGDRFVIAERKLGFLLLLLIYLCFSAFRETCFLL